MLFHLFTAILADITPQPPTDGQPATNGQVALSRTNLLAIIVAPVVVVLVLIVIIVIFVMRHRRLQRTFRAFASSHYEARSGTTTFTGADELGELLMLNWVSD